MVLLLLAYVSCCSSRRLPTLDEYCPKDAAFGQLGFKSVDSENSACVPSEHDDVGQAVYDCWRQFSIEVNGCQVTMRTDANRLVGPGRLPCHFFNLSGNLTGDGVEAQMWADVDGPGILYYYDADPTAVAALRFDSAAQLVKDIWAFLRDFTADSRFEDDTWIDAAVRKGHGGDHSGGRSSGATVGGDAERDAQSNRRQLVADGSGGLERAARRRERHAAMRVYRPSASRVALKVPDGCKYRYTVNLDSHVFESPARQRMHLQWRTIVLTVASFSVALSILGLGVCTYFSRKHAVYVASYWEYQAVKDQLGSELPPAAYERLFGEPPKAGVAAEEVAPSGSRRGAGPEPQAGATAHASGLSPAVQQHMPSALQAEAGEAPVVGAGEPDGISSRSSSSADGSMIAVAADAAGAAQAGAAADAAVPVLGSSQAARTAR